MIDKGHKKTWKQGKEMLVASIDGCSWMYDGHVLQITIQKNDGSWVQRKADKAFRVCTVRDFDRLCKRPVKFNPCVRPGCKHTWIDKEGGYTNREGMCESCFTARMRANLDQELAQEQDDKKARDRRAYAKGMRFVAVIWIHASGDDYSVEMLQNVMISNDHILRVLRNRRSRVLNDWTVYSLSKEGNRRFVRDGRNMKGDK